MLRRLFATVCWYLRQLLPLAYRTYYATEDGSIHFATWRMWFGRCFAIDDVVLDLYENLDNPVVAALVRVMGQCVGDCEHCPFGAD